MSFSYTTTDLIASVKRRGMVPTSQSTFLNTDFLTFGTEVINSHIAPLLVATREEYYTYPIDRSLVQGTSNYLIPTRAMGDGLRALYWLQSDTGNLVPIVVVDLDNIQSFNNGLLVGNSDYSAYKQGSEIVIKPMPSGTAGDLRFFIHIRPGKLVETSAAAQITSIDTGTNQVVVATIPSSWQTGTIVDIVQADPHYRYIDIDKTITGVSSTTITFSSLPSALAVGDWIALQGESPIPQIPHEMMPFLAQWIVVKCLESLGDRAGAEYAKAELMALKEDALKLVQPRIKSESKKVLNLNRFNLQSKRW
jgi:hypothetical protein